MSLSKISLFIIGTIVVLLVLALAVSVSNKVAVAPTTTVTRSLDGEAHTEMMLGGASLNVVVVNDQEKRSLGLSQVSSLLENEAMLFVFEEPGMYPFWMKEMLFPLDILWLDENGVIVHIEENLSPDTYPETFVSSVPAQYVLEINAGMTANKNIKLGDRLAI